MAKKLYYITEPRRFELPDELHEILKKAKVINPGQDVNFDQGSNQYFKGLHDAGVPGANEILDALSEYGRISLIVEDDG